MFKNVIVRQPGKSLAEGITSAPEMGRPDPARALEQHAAYVKALESCGVKVHVLPPLEEYPDSCFVEDTAVLTSRCAILSRPGAATRLGETALIADMIRSFYPADAVEQIEAPGTLEGGDVMMVGNHFYVGLSERTNEEGARQFIAALEKHGHTGSVVPLKEVLHLKTGLAYLENNNLLVAGEFRFTPDFEKYNRIEIAQEESYSANCIWVNGTVLVPAGYPGTLAAVQKAGYKTLEVDTSEYRKVDGGLSCLSLRF